MKLGTRVFLRDVETLDELGVVHAPGPVEPDNLVADAEHVYRVEIVLPLRFDARCSPVLARRVTRRTGI